MTDRDAERPADDVERPAGDAERPDVRDAMATSSADGQVDDGTGGDAAAGPNATRASPRSKATGSRTGRTDVGVTPADRAGTASCG